MTNQVIHHWILPTLVSMYSISITSVVQELKQGINLFNQSKGIKFHIQGKKKN